MVIADHAVQENHVIDWDNSRILCKESIRRTRHIREAIWIRRKSPNVMNRDEGAHYLSHVYDPLIAEERSSAQRPQGAAQVRGHHSDDVCRS